MLLYESLTGKRPFHGESGLELSANIISQTPASISAVRPEIPDMLDVVVQRALATKPEERFASADEMRRTLALAARTARLERKPIRRSRPDL